MTKEREALQRLIDLSVDQHDQSLTGQRLWPNWGLCREWLLAWQAAEVALASPEVANPTDTSFYDEPADLSSPAVPVVMPEPTVVAVVVPDGTPEAEFENGCISFVARVLLRYGTQLVRLSDARAYGDQRYAQGRADERAASSDDLARALSDLLEDGDETDRTRALNALVRYWGLSGASPTDAKPLTEGEPVAWRFQLKDTPSFGWVLTEDAKCMDLKVQEHYTVQPLYTHPSGERLEALERDAARYRFMRDEADCRKCIGDRLALIKYAWATMTDEHGLNPTATEIDDAIDAARLQQKEGSNG